MKRGFIWVCECNAGFCDFESKADALAAQGGKFCGRGQAAPRRMLKRKWKELEKGAKCAKVYTTRAKCRDFDTRGAISAQVGR